jgi:hypothetical protein
MVDVVWVALWAICGWLVGILLFFIGGFGAHVVKPIDRIDSMKLVNNVANHYSKIAMKIIGRAALVERGTKYGIYRTSHDPEKNADEFDLDGETAHVTNDTGLLSTLHKQPFGMVPPPEEDVACYVSPELGEFGHVESQRKEQGELRDSDGQYKDGVTLSEGRPLVQLRDYADWMIPGDRSLYDLDETVDLYKQSQRLFGESKTTQFMILIMAYGAAMLVTWLIVTQAGGSVPKNTVPTPPVWMGVF